MNTSNILHQVPCLGRSLDAVSVESKGRKMCKAESKKVSWDYSKLFDKFLSDKFGEIKFSPYFSSIPHDSQSTWNATGIL